MIDARRTPLAALAAARARSWLHEVPVLVMVDEAEAADAVADALDADQVVALASGDGALRRGIALVLALGRARLGMIFAEQALQHSVSALSIADVTLPDHPLVHVSSVFEELTGFPAHEVLGRNCRLLQGPETDGAAIASMRDAVAARRRAAVLVRNVRRDGTKFWNEVTVFPVVAQGASLRWMGGLQHDVTSLVEAESRAQELSRLLADRQRFVQAVLDAVEVGIVATDGDGIVRSVNRAAATAIGDAARHVGRDVRDVLKLEQRASELLGAAERVVIEHHLVADVELHLELTIGPGDGSTTDGDGHVFVFRDLGPDKLRDLEAQRLARLAAMGTMVAGFAHEVRNPVAAMRSLAESLEEDLAETGLRMPQIQRMKHVLDRVERLVRTSLQFGRPDPPRFAHHRPWELASEALASVGPRTRGLGGAVRVEVEPDLPDVFVDRGQVTQALVVVLDNALDATGSPREVLLRVGCEEAAPSSAGAPRTRPLDEVRFEVIDSGPGISADVIGRIFDPFFTTKASGTGLGLSIAQQLVNDNAGRLEVTSCRGGPTSFTIAFAVGPEADLRRRPTARPPHG